MRPSRSLLFAVLVVALSAMLGCALVGRRPASFQAYEMRGTGNYQANPFGPSAFGDPRGTEITEPTGMASVRLSDGTALLANCPLLGLRKGDQVQVQQNDDGTWIVVAR